MERSRYAFGDVACGKTHGRRERMETLFLELLKNGAEKDLTPEEREVWEKLAEKLKKLPSSLPDTKGILFGA